MGDRRNGLRRRIACLAVLLAMVLIGGAACRAEPRQPDPAGREAFARSVMAAAIAGSADAVVALADPAMTNAGPEAQQLIDSTRGWAPDSWQLGIRSDFPEIATVTAWQVGQPPSVRYTMSWHDDRWTLSIGEPKIPPTGGAKPIGPAANPKVLPGGAGSATAPATTTAPTPAPASSGCPADTTGRGVAAGAGYGADALTCRTFTSAWGAARGRDMYWLTSEPLYLSFERRDGTVTVVVRMPCGVLNVPVSADDFGLVPVPGRMAESADGCAGADADHRSWTSDYFKQPIVYRLDSTELVLTSELGQIRFRED